MPSQPKLAKHLDDLTSTDKVLRRQAALKLGKRSYEAAVGPLCTALDDKSWSVRRSAARALGQIGNAEAIEALCKALHDNSSGVRREAAIALGRIGGTRAIESLCWALWDEKGTVRMGASAALIEIGPAAVVPLCRVMEHNAAYIWRFNHARTPLRQMHRQEANSPLLALLRDTRLAMPERLRYLEMLRNYLIEDSWRPPRHLADVLSFCEYMQEHGPDAETQEGARALLDYMTLTRASTRDLTTEQERLLRPAQGTATPEGAHSLLRAFNADIAEPTEDRTSPGWSKRILRWLRRLLYRQ